MRITPLIVIVMLLLQTSWAVSEIEADCRATVERSVKNQTERLMNQLHIGLIGGLEFEKQRNEIFTEAAVRREVCEQQILAQRSSVQPQEDYNYSNAAVHATTSGRFPASVGIEEDDDTDSDL